MPRPGTPLLKGTLASRFLGKFPDLPEYHGRVSNVDPSRHREFLRLFVNNETALRAFVRSMVPTVADANDVMQEVAVVLWEKFGQLASSDDFRRWAFGVAKFKVLSWRRDQARDRHVFGTAAIELIATDAAVKTDHLEAQREALRTCLEKLPADQRQFVDSAYAPGARIEALARQLGRTPMAVYKQLHRIRMSLVECTQALLAQEGWR